jgi:hypothetical protein
VIPEKQVCFRPCSSCTKCADYYGKYTKCIECYHHADYCDCPNGIIRWWHRRKLAVTFLRLGRDPYQRGMINVQGQEAIKAEKEYSDYRHEMEEYQRNRTKFYWNM